MIDPIPTEVAAALDHAGLRARRCVEITTLHLPNLRRATYRVDLDSGEIIKARRLEDDAVARRLFELRRWLPGAFVPAFVCHGPVLLERWVHGRLLGGARPDSGRLTEAAALLADLHATRTVAGELLPGGESTSAWRLRTETGVRTLTGAGVLAEREAERLRLDLDRFDPGREIAGLGHFDFCGENMIVDELGRLRVVDNERIGVGLLGFDLARVEYRWGLEQEDWAAFRRAYGEASMAGPEVNLAFWGIVVLVHSACFRLHADPRHLLVPVGRLKRLAGASGGAVR